MENDDKYLNKARPEAEKAHFPSAAELLENALKNAANASVSRKGIAPLKVIINLNREKLRVFGFAVETKLHLIGKYFPKMDNMNPFYLDLLSLIANLDRLKQNLAKVNSSYRILKKLRYEHVGKIYAAKTIGEANTAYKAYLGRSSSVMKKLATPLAQLKEEAKKLRELPQVDFSLRTVVLAGFPNVGKTTLLKRLSGANAQISPYAFTTKQINSGYFELVYERVQLLDTPGLLDRDEINDIEAKALAALKHLANVVLFVFDPTLACGYTQEQQRELLDHISKTLDGKKFIVLLNKVDIATPQELSDAKQKLKGFTIIENGEGESFSENNERVHAALRSALGKPLK